MSGATQSGPRWLFGHPAADALIISAVFWPLLLLLRPFDGPFELTSLFFYLAIVTPHRWVTLILVFLDPDRFEQRASTFSAMFVGFFAVCIGAVLVGRSMGFGLGALNVLLAVDFIWNGWHFGSQHHGIYRIYGRMSGRPPMPAEVLERYALRLFVMYALYRVAAATMFADMAFADLMGWMSFLHRSWPLDIAMLVIPAWLVWREFTNTPRVTPRALYLVSMAAVYSGLLLTVIGHQALGLGGAQIAFAGFATAVTAFHSVEYLGIVTWATQGKRNPRGAFAGVVRHWPLILVASMAGVALLQAAAIQLGEEVALWWVVVNLAVSLLHYAYDGMIWKKGKKKA